MKSRHFLLLSADSDGFFFGARWDSALAADDLISLIVPLLRRTLEACLATLVLVFRCAILFYLSDS
jgi:hypothetical protein